MIDPHLSCVVYVLTITTLANSRPSYSVKELSPKDVEYLVSNLKAVNGAPPLTRFISGTVNDMGLNKIYSFTYESAPDKMCQVKRNENLQPGDGNSAAAKTSVTCSTTIQDVEVVKPYEPEVWGPEQKMDQREIQSTLSLPRSWTKDHKIRKVLSAKKRIGQTRDEFIVEFLTETGDDCTVNVTRLHSGMEMRAMSCRKVQVPVEKWASDENLETADPDHNRPTDEHIDRVILQLLAALRGAEPSKVSSIKQLILILQMIKDAEKRRQKVPDARLKHLLLQFQRAPGIDKSYLQFITQYLKNLESSPDQNKTEKTTELSLYTLIFDEWLRMLREGPEVKKLEIMLQHINNYFKEHGTLPENFMTTMKTLLQGLKTVPGINQSTLLLITLILNKAGTSLDNRGSDKTAEETAENMDGRKRKNRELSHFLPILNEWLGMLKKGKGPNDQKLQKLQLILDNITNYYIQHKEFPENYIKVMKTLLQGLQTVPEINQSTLLLITQIFRDLGDTSENTNLEQQIGTLPPYHSETTVIESFENEIEKLKEETRKALVRGGNRANYDTIMNLLDTLLNMYMKQGHKMPATELKIQYPSGQGDTGYNQVTDKIKNLLDWQGEQEANKQLIELAKLIEELISRLHGTEASETPTFTKLFLILQNIKDAQKHLRNLPNNYRGLIQNLILQLQTAPGVDESTRILIELISTKLGNSSENVEEEPEIVPPQHSETTVIVSFENEIEKLKEETKKALARGGDRANYDTIMKLLNTLLDIYTKHGHKLPATKMEIQFPPGQGDTGYNHVIYNIKKLLTWQEQNVENTNAQQIQVLIEELITKLQDTVAPNLPSFQKLILTINEIKDALKDHRTLPVNSKRLILNVLLQLQGTPGIDKSTLLLIKQLLKNVDDSSDVSHYDESSVEPPVHVEVQEEENRKLSHVRETLGDWLVRMGKGKMPNDQEIQQLQMLLHPLIGDYNQHKTFPKNYIMQMTPLLTELQTVTGIDSSTHSIIQKLLGNLESPPDSATIEPKTVVLSPQHSKTTVIEGFENEIKKLMKETELALADGGDQVNHDSIMNLLNTLLDMYIKHGHKLPATELEILYPSGQVDTGYNQVIDKTKKLLKELRGQEKRTDVQHIEPELFEKLIKKLQGAEALKVPTYQNLLLKLREIKNAQSDHRELPMNSTKLIQKILMQLQGAPGIDKSTLLLFDQILKNVDVSYNNSNSDASTVSPPVHEDSNDKIIRELSHVPETLEDWLGTMGKDKMPNGQKLQQLQLILHPLIGDYNEHKTFPKNLLTKMAPLLTELQTVTGIDSSTHSLITKLLRNIGIPSDNATIKPKTVIVTPQHPGTTVIEGFENEIKKLMKETEVALADGGDQANHDSIKKLLNTLLDMYIKHGHKLPATELEILYPSGQVDTGYNQVIDKIKKLLKELRGQEKRTDVQHIEPELFEKLIKKLQGAEALKVPTYQNLLLKLREIKNAQSDHRKLPMNSTKLIQNILMQLQGAPSIDKSTLLLINQILKNVDVSYNNSNSDASTVSPPVHEDSTDKIIRELSHVAVTLEDWLGTMGKDKMPNGQKLQQLPQILHPLIIYYNDHKTFPKNLITKIKALLIQLQSVPGIDKATLILIKQTLNITDDAPSNTNSEESTESTPEHDDSKEKMNRELSKVPVILEDWLGTMKNDKMPNGRELQQLPLILHPLIIYYNDHKTFPKNLISKIKPLFIQLQSVPGIDKATRELIKETLYDTDEPPSNTNSEESTESTPENDDSKEKMNRELSKVPEILEDWLGTMEKDKMPNGRELQQLPQILHPLIIYHNDHKTFPKTLITKMKPLLTQLQSVPGIDKATRLLIKEIFRDLGNPSDNTTLEPEIVTVPPQHSRKAGSDSFENEIKKLKGETEIALAYGGDEANHDSIMKLLNTLLDMYIKNGHKLPATHLEVQYPSGQADTGYNQVIENIKKLLKQHEEQAKIADVQHIQVLIEELITKLQDTVAPNVPSLQKLLPMLQEVKVAQNLHRKLPVDSKRLMQKLLLQLQGAPGIDKSTLLLFNEVLKNINFSPDSPPVQVDVTVRENRELSLLLVLLDEWLRKLEVEDEGPNGQKLQKLQKILHPLTSYYNEHKTFPKNYITTIKPVLMVLQTVPGVNQFTLQLITQILKNLDGSVDKNNAKEQPPGHSDGWEKKIQEVSRFILILDEWLGRLVKENGPNAQKMQQLQLILHPMIIYYKEHKTLPENYNISMKSFLLKLQTVPELNKSTLQLITQILNKVDESSDESESCELQNFMQILGLWLRKIGNEEGANYQKYQKLELILHLMTDYYKNHGKFPDNYIATMEALLLDLQRVPTISRPILTLVRQGKSQGCGGCCCVECPCPTTVLPKEKTVIDRFDEE